MSKLDGSEPRPTIGSDPYMSLDRCQGRETWSLLQDDRFALGVTIFMLGYFKYPFGQSKDKKSHSSCKENENYIDYCKSVMTEGSDPFDFFEKFEKKDQRRIPDKNVKELILTLLHPEPDKKSPLSEIMNREFLSDHS